MCPLALQINHTSDFVSVLPNSYNKNLLLIAQLSQTNGKASKCKTSGILLPTSSGLQLKNVTFHGFNGPTCAAITGPRWNVSELTTATGGYEIEME